MKKSFVKFSRILGRVLRSNRAKATIPLESLLEVDLSDKMIGAQIYRDGIWEPHVTNAFIHSGRKSDCIIDIGANIGYYSVLAAKLVGPRNVLSFEPDRDLFISLCKNLLLNNALDVSAFNCALSSSEGIARIYRSSSNSGDNRLGIRNDLDQDFTSTPCLTIALDHLKDSISEYKNITVKIDVQGYETFVFEGMQQLLAKGCISSIIAEYCPTLIKASGRHQDELLNMIASFGYTIHIITREGEILPVKKQDILLNMPSWDSPTGPFLDLLFSINK